MRNPERIPELLDLIKKEWEKYPDFRLGQFLINEISAIRAIEGLPPFSCPEIFYFEDDKLIDILKKQQSTT